MMPSIDLSKVDTTDKLRVYNLLLDIQGSNIIDDWFIDNESGLLQIMDTASKFQPDEVFSHWAICHMLSDIVVIKGKIRRAKIRRNNSK